MRRLILASTLAIASGVSFAAHAQQQPPAEAMPLSEVVAALEAAGDVASFESIEWDDDGYWEVEYWRADGSEVEVRIDPMTGEPRN